MGERLKVRGFRVLNVQDPELRERGQRGFSESGRGLGLLVGALGLGFVGFCFFFFVFGHFWVERLERLDNMHVAAVL